MDIPKFGTIEEIKQMKNTGARRWGNLLAPYCKEYFEANLPIAYIRTRLYELYELQVSTDTIKALKKQYKQALKPTNTADLPIKSVPLTNSTKAVSSIPVTRKQATITLEEAAERVRNASFPSMKNPLDELIEKQQNRLR